MKVTELIKGVKDVIAGREQRYALFVIRRSDDLFVKLAYVDDARYKEWIADESFMKAFVGVYDPADAEIGQVVADVIETGKAAYPDIEVRMC